MNVIVTPWTILARALKFYAPLPFGKLSLSGTTLTRRTLELADRSITHPKGVVEDVFVKVGSFHFPTDFVVVDFRSLILMYPLILEIPFQDGRALIDVYEGEAYFKGRSKDNNNSILKEDVQEENFQVYSNPLFEFDDNYNFSDVNPLFDKVLEDIECKDSYDSNLDESTFLVTPLFDSNEDECLAPGDDIEFLLHHDPSTLMKSIASILEWIINEHLSKENDRLFALEM
ncbi:retrotransposon protein, putative, ty3-gypsy subclass [Tanacetum coccineum]